MEVDLFRCVGHDRGRLWCSGCGESDRRSMSSRARRSRAAGEVLTRQLPDSLLAPLAVFIGSEAFKIDGKLGAEGAAHRILSGVLRWSRTDLSNRLSPVVPIECPMPPLGSGLCRSCQQIRDCWHSCALSRLSSHGWSSRRTTLILARSVSTSRRSRIALSSPDERTPIWCGVCETATTLWLGPPSRRPRQGRAARNSSHGSLATLIRRCTSSSDPSLQVMAWRPSCLRSMRPVTVPLRFAPSDMCESGHIRSRCAIIPSMRLGCGRHSAARLLSRVLRGETSQMKQRSRCFPMGSILTLSGETSLQRDRGSPTGLLPRAS